MKNDEIETEEEFLFRIMEENELLFESEKKRMKDKIKVLNAKIKALEAENQELIMKCSRALNPKIEQEKQNNIIEYRKKGMSMGEIAKIMCVSKATVFKYTRSLAN